VALADCLRRLHKRDPGEFRIFINESGLSRRKAYYLLKIGQRIDQAALPIVRLRKIGWTKLEVIGDHLTRHSAAELLKLAEENTTHDLKSLMRGEKTKPNARCVLMYFSPKQYEEFESAVLEHGGRRSGRGLLNKELAIIQVIRSASGSSASNVGSRMRKALLAR